MEECLTIKLAILCEKIRKKIDVDFRRTGTLTHYHKLSQAGHAQDQENVTTLAKDSERGSFRLNLMV